MMLRVAVVGVQVTLIVSPALADTSRSHGFGTLVHTPLRWCTTL